MSVEDVRIFIGHDARESDAYAVCERSLRMFSSVPLDIKPLSMVDLANKGIYTRRTIRDADGRLWDDCGGELTPMSTTFSLARFFVPFLCGYRGWAIFVDCDFMFRADVAELWSARSDKYAVQVVKHCYYVRQGPKMDGQVNEPYPRKNWSSLMLFNCGHKACLALNPKLLNSAAPGFLHQFKWCSDDQIGQLPFEWNWLALDPKAVHFTYGVPTMRGYELEPYADEWMAHYRQIFGWHGRPTQEGGQADTQTGDSQADT